MGKRSKRLERLRTRPNDFTWGELRTLLIGLGYEEEKGGGSRHKFFHPVAPNISLHEPHGGRTLKRYAIDIVKVPCETGIEALDEGGF
jgi:hypothetical protein